MKIFSKHQTDKKVPGPAKKKPRPKRKYKNGLCKFGKFWWVCIKKDGKKIERSTGCTTKEAALLVLASLHDSMACKKLGIQYQGPFDVPTLEEAALEWHKVKEKSVSPRYREQMLEAVRIHMRDWKDLPITEITSEVMEQVIHDYNANNGTKTLKGVEVSVEHSEGGGNRIIRLISALFGWCVRTKKWISERPWDCAECKVQEISRPILWPEQVQEFLSNVEKSTESRIIRLSIFMQIGLGLRESETATANWRWFKRRNAIFEPSITKNRKIRAIPVPAWLNNLLIEEWERQGQPSAGLILPYGGLDQQVYRGFTKNAIASAGKKMGVDGLHPHRLRATFCTAHFEAGTTINTIMIMVGHKHQATTMRYIETRSKDAREAQDEVAVAMGFKSSTKTTT